VFLFDFDGVLMDSVDEVAVTAFNAVAGEEARSLDALPGDLADRFRRNRFHAQGAAGIFALMAGCLAGEGGDSVAPMTGAAYERLLESAAVPAEERRERFFAARRRFQADDPTVWLELNRPYPEVWEAILRRGPRRTVLMTSKNREAAIRLCRHFGLELAEENVFSGDGGARKPENLDRIYRRFGADRYTFIDDHLKNLREVDAHARERNIELAPVLARWGYTAPDAAGAARELGFAVMSRADLVAALESDPDAET
jgi:FMN phosphatase YigB (HAD superfamily)